jgi:hypothetical protein
MKGTDHSLESFRPLLDGTTNWPAVMEALDKIGYRDYLTFEYFHPYLHYPEALVTRPPTRWTACWGGTRSWCRVVKPRRQRTRQFPRNSAWSAYSYLNIVHGLNL